MRVIARRHLSDFGDAHPLAAPALAHWYEIARRADWATMQEAAAAFSKAKAINAQRIRYDIGGGAFRLVCAIDFPRRVVFVKFVGTHAEYDHIDAATVARF